MKKVLIVIASFACFSGLHAQSPVVQTAGVTEAPYLRFPTIPPFRLLKVDSSSYYTKDDLKKNRRTIIMFFSPDCEHCKHQTRDMLGDFSKFKDIEIVMATFQPFTEMKEFYAYFRIADHSNIKMGRDEKYFLPPYYKMQSLPYIALYDKKGNYITHFEGNQKVDTIINAFNGK